MTEIIAHPPIVSSDEWLAAAADVWLVLRIS
jgi:hypothetical protein